MSKPRIRMTYPDQTGKRLGFEFLWERERREFEKWLAQRGLESFRRWLKEKGL